MPMYDWECNECGHTFEEMATYAERDTGIPCPECGSESSRVFSAPKLHWLNDKERRDVSLQKRARAHAAKGAEERAHMMASPVEASGSIMSKKGQEALMRAKGMKSRGE